MKKRVWLSALAAFSLMGIAATVFAQEEPVKVAPEETITISDLGTQEPKILPTSPFYFFKELGRNLQSFVTFNPVSKAELELKFANEKAAELKKVSETKPDNTQAIQKALENYRTTQGKLQKKLEGLSETSQNPKVDDLLNNLTDKVVKHEKLFDEIAFRFEQKEAEPGSRVLTNTINETKSGSENIMGEVSLKDDPAKFASRLEKVLLEEKGGDLKNVRSVEIIDNFSAKVPEKTKEALQKLRVDFSEKLEQDIKDVVEREGEDAVKEKMLNTPGDFAARSVIIEEIQKRAEERVSQILEKAMGQIENVIRKETDLAQKAKEQIDRAEKVIQEAEKIASQPATAKIPPVSSTLLAEAKENIKNARDAFSQEKYGEAFGQARSAEVLARNALRFFDDDEMKKPEKRPIKESAEKKIPIAAPCEDFQKRIVELKELFVAEKIPEPAFREKYDAYMREMIVCQEKKIAPTPVPVGPIKVPVLPPVKTLPTPVPPQEFCDLEYKPVCGSNGKTYSNACRAKVARMGIAYEGECKIEKPPVFTPVYTPDLEQKSDIKIIEPLEQFPEQERE